MGERVDDQLNQKVKGALRSSKIPDEVKAQAWDSFFASDDPGKFRSAFDSLKIPQDVKRTLWDLRFAPPNPPGPPNEKSNVGQKPKATGPSIGVDHPSIEERLVATIREGAIGRALHLSTETQESRKEDPSNPLVRFESAVPEHGAIRGALKVASGLTEPDSLSMMAVTGGLGTLQSALGKTAMSRLVSLGFSGKMIWEAAKEVPGFVDAVKKKDWPMAREIATKAGLEGLLAAKGIKHGLGEGNSTPVPESKGEPSITRVTYEPTPLRGQNLEGMQYTATKLPGVPAGTTIIPRGHVVGKGFVVDVVDSNGRITEQTLPMQDTIQNLVRKGWIRRATSPVTNTFRGGTPEEPSILTPAVTQKGGVPATTPKVAKPTAPSPNPFGDPQSPRQLPSPPPDPKGGSTHTFDEWAAREPDVSDGRSAAAIDPSRMDPGTRAEYRQFLDLLKSEGDQLGFDSNKDAVRAILLHKDWATRWDVRDPKLVELGNKFAGWQDDTGAIGKKAPAQLPPAPPEPTPESKAEVAPPSESNVGQVHPQIQSVIQKLIDENITPKSRTPGSQNLEHPPWQNVKVQLLDERMKPIDEKSVPASQFTLEEIGKWLAGKAKAVYISISNPDIATKDRRILPLPQVNPPEPPGPR